MICMNVLSPLCIKFAKRCCDVFIPKDFVYGYLREFKHGWCAWSRVPRPFWPSLQCHRWCINLKWSNLCLLTCLGWATVVKQWLIKPWHMKSQRRDSPSQSQSQCTKRYTSCNQATWSLTTHKSSQATRHFVISSDNGTSITSMIPLPQKEITHGMTTFTFQIA